MFDSKSRYAGIATKVLEQPSPVGPRVVTYVGRRFIPPARTDVTLVEHVVRAGERLDTITARYLGEPTLFWQICDATVVLSPSELTASPGRVDRRIRIALRLT
jgi:hypothetical protein